MIILFAWLLFNVAMAPTVWRLERCYPDRAEPVACPHCGGEELISRVVDRFEQTPCELAVHCGNCREDLGFWAYGHWDPAYADSLRLGGYIMAALVAACVAPVVYLTAWL